MKEKELINHIRKANLAIQHMNYIRAHADYIYVCVDGAGRYFFEWLKAKGVSAQPITNVRLKKTKKERK